MHTECKSTIVKVIVYKSCTELSLISEVPNRRADRNKQEELEKNATLLAYLKSKSINEQDVFFIYYSLINRRQFHIFLIKPKLDE